MRVSTKQCGLQSNNWQKFIHDFFIARTRRYRANCLLNATTKRVTEDGILVALKVGNIYFFLFVFYRFLGFVLVLFSRGAVKKMGKMAKF